MPHLLRLSGPAWLLALSLAACTAPGAGLPKASLALGAQAEAARGGLLLELAGLPYQLQALADLASLRVVLKCSGQVDVVRTVDAAAMRAGQGRISFESLAVGPWTVEVQGFDAQGRLLGWTRANAAVSAGGTTRLPLRLALGDAPAPEAVQLGWAGHDESASDVARPLKLVASARLPAMATDERNVVRDMAFDRQSRELWVALGEAGLKRFRPDLSASSTAPLARAYSLGAMPQGGVMVCEGVSPEHFTSHGPSMSPVPVRRLFPDGSSSVVDQLADHLGHAFVMTTNPEGQPVYLRGHDRQIVGPGMPSANSVNTSPSWRLSTPAFQFPSYNLYVSFGQLPFAKMESGARPGEFVVHDSYSAAHVTDRGVGEKLIGCASSDPQAVVSETLIAQNEVQINSGNVKALLVGVAPDHRGGFWAVTRTYGIYHQMIAVWRRSPGGRWSRVWGPWLSPSELQVVASVPTANGSNYGGAYDTTAHRLESQGVRKQTNESRDLLTAHWAYGNATSMPGRLAITNASGVFVLEEQVASAP